MIDRYLKSVSWISALALVAACSGGDDAGTAGGSGAASGSGSGDVSGLAGLFGTGGGEDFSAADLPEGTGSEFVARLQEVDDRSEVFRSTLTSAPTVPTSGTATFSGTGGIADVNIPQDADTVPEIAGYAAVATRADASVDFGSGDFSARQYDFLDIADAPVSGEVTYAGRIASSGVSDDTTVSGSIAGTAISATGPDKAGGGYVGVADPLFLGFFTAVGSGGTYDGVELGGGFFAAED